MRATSSTARPMAAAFSPGLTARYEGDWRDGQVEDRSVETWPDGARYEGNISDGLFHARGSGRHYESDWRDGKAEGRGTFNW